MHCYEDSERQQIEDTGDLTIQVRNEVIAAVHDSIKGLHGDLVLPLRCSVMLPIVRGGTWHMAYDTPQHGGERRRLPLAWISSWNSFSKKPKHPVRINVLRLFLGILNHLYVWNNLKHIS